MTHATTNTIEAITQLFQSYLVKGEGDKFQSQGAKHFAQRIFEFVDSQRSVEFILPGFPCKSPNTLDKTFSTMPDFGEVTAIEKLDQFCKDIGKVYPPGARITILSDGTTFNDIVCVDEDVKNSYRDALRSLVATHCIRWVDLAHMLALSPSRDSTVLREKLLGFLPSKKRSLSGFVQYVEASDSERRVHDKLCSYLYHDIHLERFVDSDRDSYLNSIAKRAFQMMQRGRALSHMIDAKYPSHIRLSVHQYDNAGPKFTFSLTHTPEHCLVPWHTVPVRRLSGEFVQLPHNIASELRLAMVTFEKQNWCYLELPEGMSTEHQFTLVKMPCFGLTVQTQNGRDPQDISAPFLQSLSRTFGFVVLKGVEFEDQQQLVAYGASLGECYHWKSGPVHVVKPDDQPDGFVHSLEKTPLHWDLSLLPADTPQVVANNEFSAETILLYCKTPPAAAEGQTTLVDSRSVLKGFSRQRVEDMKNTEVTYHTKLTYFGGDPRSYPLVFQHPLTKEDLLRYMEGSDSKLQTLTLTTDVLPQSDFDALIKDINDACYDQRCLVEHEWEASDLLIADNYYTLHGRLAMTDKSRSRELWRVQTV